MSISPEAIVLITQLVSYSFVVLVLFFILSIIRLIYLDVTTMRRAKAKAGDKAYLKLINLRSRLPFSIAESYVLGPNNIIGRNRICNICYMDKTLSGNHARIFEENDKFYLEDLNSKNGTVLNGNYIPSGNQMEIRDGDKINVGMVTFLFIEVRAEQEA